jgi:hypothetical protein
MKEQTLSGESCESWPRPESSLICSPDTHTHTQQASSVGFCSERQQCQYFLPVTTPAASRPVTSPSATQQRTSPKANLLNFQSDGPSLASPKGRNVFFSGNGVLEKIPGLSVSFVNLPEGELIRREPALALTLAENSSCTDLRILEAIRDRRLVNALAPLIRVTYYACLFPVKVYRDKDTRMLKLKACMLPASLRTIFVLLVVLGVFALQLLSFGRMVVSFTLPGVRSGWYEKIFKKLTILISF